jgi:hypothetical protein
MPLAPGSVQPNDTLVTPIVQQLAIVAQQIAGIGTCYTEPLDQAPEDNSVLFPLRGWKVLDDTSAKLKVELTFEVLHLFARTNLPDALARAYSFVPAWLTVLTAWGNNELGGLAITVSLLEQPATVKGFEWAKEPFIAISTLVTVLTEFSINTQ